MKRILVPILVVALLLTVGVSIVMAGELDSKPTDGVHDGVCKIIAGEKYGGDYTAEWVWKSTGEKTGILKCVSKLKDGVKPPDGKDKIVKEICKTPKGDSKEVDVKIFPTKEIVLTCKL